MKLGLRSETTHLTPALSPLPGRRGRCGVLPRLRHDHKCLPLLFVRGEGRGEESVLAQDASKPESVKERSPNSGATGSGKSI
jgi:hypothetical protein